MLSYIVRRLFLMIPTILAISAIVFVIIQLPPGDYFTSVVNEIQSRGESADKAKLEFLKSQYGFDKPLHIQYFHWVGGMLEGDFGYSFEHDKPVTDVVGDRLLLTFIVSLTTIIFTWAIAFPIGVYSAVKQYSVGDYTLTFIGFIGLATPNFLLALILQYFAHIWFDISIGGLMDPIYVDQPWTWEKSLSVMQHIWIPVLVIGTAGTASMIRRLRANLLDELSKQYFITARAKGLPPLRALLKYPLRSALNPFVADIGNMLPQIVSGAAIVSVVLSLPTTGPMLLSALQSQDMYLAGSFLMFLAALTVIGTLISDLALAALDPRIRLDKGLQR
ncbi:MAG: ABC transporter permease [Pseudomonadota bacterium]|nr:ABC transporter permease [Pseudomonadota bacterium]